MSNTSKHKIKENYFKNKNYSVFFASRYCSYFNNTKLEIMGAFYKKKKHAGSLHSSVG